MKITNADLSHPQVIGLLQIHLAGMYENSPPEQVFALDLSAFKQPGIQLYCAWLEDIACGIGALKTLNTDEGEIKSMRTHPDCLKQGVASRLLEHIIQQAKIRGIGRLMLETGSGEAFDPAIRLYQRYGFISGPAFGDYEKSPFNQFFHLNLD
ncbi:GNAT family N-acetyltransferase [Bowmanella yangjiangensis]|uniref:GNAT family N-acetyltransferase n=1 Tax=Bowmanella yangjiangensis TaxID=2811230 RepID=A0ABS3CSP8_9ALTE|nr:GNAT family N-acetyltransferase [Bowmanella yangjiangensis]MBN7819446.1 GNAT family N-acetyltransferase [Bowmanella yangjiangensis]